MYDGWLNCTKEGPYFAGIWLIKILDWTMLIAGGVLAKKFNQWLRADVLCMTLIAAEFILGSIERFVEDALLLGNPSPAQMDQVRYIMEIFEINKAILVYVLSGIGYFCQRTLQEWWDGDETDRSEIICIFRWLLHPYVDWMSLPLVKWEILVLKKMLVSLESGVETLQDALEDVKAVSERSMSFDLHQVARSAHEVYEHEHDSEHCGHLADEKAEKGKAEAEKAQADKGYDLPDLGKNVDDVILQSVEVDNLAKEKAALETQLQELQDKFRIAEQDWQAKLKTQKEELNGLQGASSL